MSIKVVCPNGHELKVKDELAGKTGLCPTCKAKVVIPPLDAKTSKAAESAAQAVKRADSGDDLTEDAILGILGPYEPDRRVQVPLEEPPTRARPGKPTTRVCRRCHEEVTGDAHICPNCRTYIGG